MYGASSPPSIVRADFPMASFHPDCRRPFVKRARAPVCVDLRMQAIGLRRVSVYLPDEKPDKVDAALKFKVGR